MGHQRAAGTSSKYFRDPTQEKYSAVDQYRHHQHIRIIELRRRVTASEWLPVCGPASREYV